MDERRAFAVVTPNLNMGQYLGKTIESVLRNLRPGDQYFVVDGGSIDNSTEIIQSYSKYLTGWISEPDHGYADAIAKGFEGTQSHYLCWINSGDLLLDGALDMARKHLEDTEVDFIFGDDVYIDKAGQIIHFSNGSIRSLRNAMLYGGWTPLQDACFWRRDLYERVGGISRELKYAADFDLFLRFAIEGRYKYVNATFSAFRQHESQKSIAGNHNYALERAHCRRRELQKFGGFGFQSLLMEAWYWFSVRCKAHFQTRVPPGQRYRGSPVELLRSEPYER